MSIKSNQITNQLYVGTVGQTYYADSNGLLTANSVLTFDGTNFILSNLTANTIVYGDGSKKLQSVTIGTGLSFSAGTLSATASNTLTNTHIFVGNASNVATDVAMSGDATMANTGALTIANLAVTTAKINTAAVTYAKIQNVATVSLLGNPTGSPAAPSEITLGTGLSFSGTTLTATGLSTTLTNTHIFVGNASNVATDVAMSGDATMANTGALTIANGAITNAKVSASAAIDFSKLATLTSANILVGNGSNVAASVAVSGAISITNAGVTAYVGTQGVTTGGTGLTAATTGDILYASATNTYSRLAVGTTGQNFVIRSGIPSWEGLILVSKSGNYTFGLGDEMKAFELTGSSAFTFTVDTNTNVAFAIGTLITVTQTGTGVLTIAGAGGVTINSPLGLILSTQYSSGTLWKQATNTWLFSGNTRVS